MSATPTAPRAVIRSQHLLIEFDDLEQTLLLTATREFIPEDEFQEMLRQLDGFMCTHLIRKIIFDQRQLRHFHARSTEWMVCHWLPRLREYGLTTCCYLLPDDRGYQMAYYDWQETLTEEYPPTLLQGIHVYYCASFMEAIER